MLQLYLNWWTSYFARETKVNVQENQFIQTSTCKIVRLSL